MVYLAYTGAQNMFLTESPTFSHFKTMYARDTPYTTQNIEVPFENKNPRPGDTLIASIPQKGAYISGISLKLVLPKLTANSSNWVYDSPQQNGEMLAYASNGATLFTVTLSGSDAYSNTDTWYTDTPSTAVSVSASTNKFSFSASAAVSYVVFTNISVANFWGFVYNPQFLFGGYVKFTINNLSTFTSQVTFQESGWLPVGGTDPNVSYADNVTYKFVNNAALHIGNQQIQVFDTTFLKGYNESTTSYKNRPVLKLLEGNTNVVDFNRTYYMRFPFVTPIPFHALSRNEVRVVIETNPFDFFEFTATVIIDYLLISADVKLPSEYTIPVVQIARFDTPAMDSRGSMKSLVTFGDPDFKFSINGEQFVDSDLSNVSGFENLLNLPLTSNVIVFNNTLNMSRIRDQQFASSNTLVYTQSVNFLRVSADIAGLMFDYSSTVLNKRLGGSIKI